MSEWDESQEWEKQWHGNCVNSYEEEIKQFVYAKKMGIQQIQTPKSAYNLLFNGKILDMGGGAYSMLLKGIGYEDALVVDPCQYPDWVYKRYDAAGIRTMVLPGEMFNTTEIFDEAIMYNVLQHTLKPEKIVENILHCSKIVRVFEWVENGISRGHPVNLHKDELDKWFGGNGRVESLNENHCVGLAYYGVFKGKHYG